MKKFGLAMTAMLLAVSMTACASNPSDSGEQKLRIGIIPVSYTHLDVYKRQVNGFDTHENLLRTNPIYREIYEAQTQNGGDFEDVYKRQGKVPKASFGGRMIPRYLLHYDFVLIRDFLDLFFLSLPRIDSLVRNNYAAFAYGPKHLTQLGFEEHRRRLLEP